MLKFGDMELSCANLPDGRRVVNEAEMMRALGRNYSGYYSKRDTAQGIMLPRYLSPAVLKPYISEELKQLLEPIAYTSPPEKGGVLAKGVNAEALPQICEVWLQARAEGKLKPDMLGTATKAELLIRGLARVGIAALIDEATGFQEARDKDALRALLDRYLETELAAWAKRFPDEFYQGIFRLRGWQWRGMNVGPKPQVVGHYTNNMVYARLAPGILKELKERMPKAKEAKGVKRAAYHQLLTEDVGHPALAQHLHAVIGLMRVASTWDQFMDMLDRAFPKKGDTLQLPFATVPENGPGPEVKRPK